MCPSTIAPPPSTKSTSETTTPKAECQNKNKRRSCFCENASVRCKDHPLWSEKEVRLKCRSPETPTIPAKSTPSKTTPSNPNDPSTLDSSLEDEESGEGDSGKDQLSWIIVSVIVVMLITTGILVKVFFIMRKRRRRRQATEQAKRRQEKKGEDGKNQVRISSKSIALKIASQTGAFTKGVDNGNLNYALSFESIAASTTGYNQSFTGENSGTANISSQTTAATATFATYSSEGKSLSGPTTVGSTESESSMFA